MRLAALLVAGAWLAAGSAAGAQASVRHLHATVSAPRTVAVPPSKLKIIYLAPPYKHAPSRKQLTQEGNADVTVQTTAYSVVAGQDGNTYTFSTVGGDVTALGTGTTTVGLQVTPMIITFSGTGDVYDATSVNSGCGEVVSPVTGVFTGPMLTMRRWYAGSRFIGNGQYLDALQRGSFWGNDNPSGSSPNYHVLLSGSEPALISAAFNGGSEVNAGTCSALGEFDMGTFDNFIQGFIKSNPGIWSSTAVPLFLFKNVVFTTNGGATCCILGWHSAFTDENGNTQTYAIADYITDGEFGSTTDQAPLSHELGEWGNDPFVNNATPAWGHIGQQPNCQNNLEVGDPLSGTVFAVPPPTVNSPLPTYHLQELAYWDWFYDFGAGVNGWDSTRGTFTSGATLCS